MTGSYLGIITPRGLELLVRETEHAAPFVLRRTYRQSAEDAVCCWAVLPEEIAQKLARYIRHRWYLEALVVLNGEARQVGTLLPDWMDDSDAQPSGW
jgi:hypothetical protein